MILQLDTLKGEPVLFLDSQTRTNSLLDHLYRVRDRVKIWLDAKNLNLLKVEKHIREGRHSYDHIAFINQADSIAITNKEPVRLPGPVFDPIGAIYAVRSKPLALGRIFHFTTYDNGKLREVVVTVSRIETISVPAGIFKCFVVSPSSADGKKLLKQDGQMEIWFTDDERQLPVKIEQRTSIGTMILELKEVVLPEPEDESEETPPSLPDLQLHK